MATDSEGLSRRAKTAIALLISSSLTRFIPVINALSLWLLLAGVILTVIEMKSLSSKAAAQKGLPGQGTAAITLLVSCILWFVLAIADWHNSWAWVLFYICLIIGLVLLIPVLRQKKAAEQTQPTGAAPATTKPIGDYIDLTAPYIPSTIALLNKRYEVVREIAKGGMAVISLAKDHQEKTPCAIKIPRLDTQTDPKITTDKLKIEAEHLRQLRHDHIVRFIDLFRHNYTPHLVMEYIEGVNLLDAFAKKGAPEGMALLWAKQILDALEYLHKLGFIHRDLNPGNILVRPDRSAVIIDFGTIKEITAKDNPGSQDYTSITKPGFPIPELLNPGRADGRADLYGVGNTLFYLLTSTKPGLRANNTDIADLLITKEVSERTAKCIAQAMSIDPDLRFKDAGAMRNALGV